MGRAEEEANAAKEEALLMVAKEALTKSKQDALAKVSEKETITNTSKQKDQGKMIDQSSIVKTIESKEEVKDNTSKTIAPKNKVAEAIEAKIEEIEREERERLAKEAKEKESIKNMSKEENIEVSRHISNRRMSSDQGIRHEERTRRESGRSGSGGAWTPTEIPAVKPKPVLTEEMERQIIYGSFKKKESREDKLKAVKKEIELRFKEEEEKRRREKEEREERDRKERNKQRLQDEKMKKALKEKKEANKKRKIEEKHEKVEKVEQS